MRIAMFYHSLLSDWNHGNAHFLRGIVSGLLSRNLQVEVFEPEDSWSVQNLVAEHGQKPLRKFYAAYPSLKSTAYAADKLDLNRALNNADLVIVHEWNSHELVRRIGEHRKAHRSFKLLFHDTHHRMVTAPETMAAYDLSNYDGVLAYGNVLRDLYQKTGRARQVWTWHEAADVRMFYPRQSASPEFDLVWIGNWGDDERTEELSEFLIDPVTRLGLKARVYGVRYPAVAKQALSKAGIEYGGWLPNFEVPRVFANARVTAHVPRRPYVKALPGIPTIRPFEALACGIPLVCSPWDDADGLFRPGQDYLIARDGSEMTERLKTLMVDDKLRAQLARSGLETIRARHTCAHRVGELMRILDQLGDVAAGVSPAVEGGILPPGISRRGLSRRATRPGSTPGQRPAAAL